MILIDQQLMQYGIDIKFRQDGGFNNIKHFKAKSKCVTCYITDLDYDCVKAALNLNDLEGILSCFNSIYEGLVLMINIDQTIMSQFSSTNNQAGIRLQLNSRLIERVQHFSCPGSYISSVANLDAEINYKCNRIKQTRV